MQRWMEDLRHMTEVECMCVLQAKPIGVEEDGQQGELIVASGDQVARNNLQTLLRRALVVSTELGKMFQRLEKGRWQRVHSTAVRANCHVRSLVHEYGATRSTPPEMQKVTESLPLGSPNVPPSGPAGRAGGRTSARHAEAAEATEAARSTCFSCRPLEVLQTKIECGRVSPDRTAIKKIKAIIEAWPRLKGRPLT